MFWTNIKRVFRSGFISFWRNGVISIASILVMTVTLVVLGSLVLSSAFLNASLNNFKDKVDITVSFKPDADDNDILNIKNAVTAMPEVKSIEYVSKDKALADFRETHKDNGVILQSLDELGNPFGVSLNIKAKDPTQYENISTFLTEKDKTSSGSLIDQITFKKDIIDRLVRIINSSKRVAMVISLTLIFMSILVTFNTISLAIYTTREEISVMKLVGAGDNYVRGPFVVEGIISGVISAFVAITLLYPAAMWITSLTAGVYGGINLVGYYADYFARIFLILLGSGIFLGMVSSYFAIRKYLKV